MLDLQKMLDTRDCSPAEIIARLKIVMLACPQAKLDMQHEFPSPGHYRRTMNAPAQCIIVGKKHRTPGITKLVSGKIAVWDEENGARLLEAPHEEFSPKGIQRVGLTVTPVVWQEIFQTEETDVQTLEKILAIDE